MCVFPDIHKQQDQACWLQATLWPQQRGLTVVVSADLQRSVSPHQDTDGSLVSVFEQLDVTGAPLLPLRRVVLRGKAVQLGAPIVGRMFDTQTQSKTWLRL